MRWEIVASLCSPTIQRGELKTGRGPSTIKLPWNRPTLACRLRENEFKSPRCYLRTPDLSSGEPAGCLMFRTRSGRGRLRWCRHPPPAPPAHPKKSPPPTGIASRDRTPEQPRSWVTFKKGNRCDKVGTGKVTRCPHLSALRFRRSAMRRFLAALTRSANPLVLAGCRARDMWVVVTRPQSFWAQPHGRAAWTGSKQ